MENPPVISAAKHENMINEESKDMSMNTSEIPMNTSEIFNYGTYFVKEN